MNELSLKVYGDRFRCKELSSLHDEYFVVSMLDVFISQGKVQHAEPVLNMYRRKGHQFTIQVYNQLINGWAEQGNPAKATLLYETMIDDGITPNSHTYAILLCLYYKLNITDKLNDLIGSIRDKGYTLEHLPYQVSMSPPQMNSFLQLLDDLNIQPVKPNRRDASSYPTLVQSAYSTNDNQFNNPSDDVSQDLNDKIISKINDQFEIERKGYLEIKSILKAPTNNDADNDVSNTLKELYTQWEVDLTAAIREELAQYEACLKTMEENWFSIYHLPKHLPFLATLKPEEWAQILVEEAVVMSLIRQPLGQPVFYLCQSILQPAWRKYVIHQKEKRGMDGQIERIYRKYIHFVLTRSRQWSREYWNDLQEEEQYGMTEHHIPLWPFTVGIYIGTALIDILLRTLKLPDKLISDEDDGNQWAFEHAYEFENEKRVGYIRPHPSLYSMVKRLHTKAIPMHFKMESFELPMLVPPKPWTRVNEGGYLLTPCSIVRGHSDTYQHQLLLEATQEMTPILDSLNYLGAYPWRVNTRILDIVIELFNNGGDESLDVPSTLSLPDIPVIPKDCDDQTRRSISKQRKFAKKIHKENFSLRMDMLYKLSMSNHYRDDLFWLPHNMDFRSRVYPIPPHITHLSSDVGRSLIQFGIGYPLGKRGLEWLMIHIATLHGATSK
jgi:DNA-directed RNA polymerase